jgi:hypothetical protein
MRLRFGVSHGVDSFGRILAQVLTPEQALWLSGSMVSTNVAPRGTTLLLDVGVKKAMGK